MRKIREAKAALEAEVPWRMRSRLSPRDAIISGCLMTRRSGTSPTRTPGSCPAREGGDFQQSYNCQAVVDSEHQVIVAACATDQPSDKDQAVSMIEEAILNVGTVPKGSLRRRRILLGQGGGGTLRPGSGPVRRAGEDPPRLGAATGAPWPHTEGAVSQGPDAAQAADETGQGTLRVFGWRRWNRYSGRSSRAGASGSSCCGVWLR